ncbi:MAG TPA: hypothetical protein VGB64_06690 [Actinomycetota bacterium]
MRKLNRMLVTAGLVAAMVAPSPARALLISECGGYYSSVTSCTFSIAGPTLIIYGSSSRADLQVRVTDAAGAVWILSCSGGTSCSAQLGPQAMGTDSFGLPAGGPLLCSVISQGAGYYRCTSVV